MLPKLADLVPMFTMGPLWGHILVEYLKRLKWPVNDTAKQLTKSMNIGELMLDLWLSTGIKPPVLVKNGPLQKDKTYVFIPSGTLDTTPICERLHQFTLALSSLSRITGYEVIPGLNSDFKTALLTKGGKHALTGRAVLHSPQSLVNPQAVARWKAQQQNLYTNLRDVSKLPLDNCVGPFPMQIDTTVVPEFSFQTLYRERKLKTERLRNAGTPISDNFGPAQYTNKHC